MKSIEVRIRRNADELWEEVFGSLDASMSPWVKQLRFVTGDESRHGLCYVTAENADDWGDNSPTKVYRIYVEEIAEAYGKLASADWKHCNGCGLDDPDACTADAVLQTATYGEIIFG